MKYYIIAGEASGDLHGSNLMKALLEKDKEATIHFWGGNLMQDVGGKMIKHYRELAFMGFIEVLFHLKTILNNLHFCKNDILDFQPNVIIFIDYPGFNLRIAKWAKSHGIKTHYYISPQIWAWKESRIHQIKRDIDSMYVILPFEKDFYEVKHQFPVTFVGHPLIDAVKNHQTKNSKSFFEEHTLTDKPIIAILPGSRKQEIAKMLTIMLSIVDDFPNYQFVIAGAPSQEYSFYSPFIKKDNITFIANKTYDLLANASAALVTSGTATLETALFKVPEVVCYKGNWISYQIAKRIITLKYISLVNLIMDKEVVCELIQDKCNSHDIKKALEKILDSSYRKEILNNYELLEQKLGGVGASKKTAHLIVNDLIPL